jgi:hypothetical protein
VSLGFPKAASPTTINSSRFFTPAVAFCPLFCFDALALVNWLRQKITDVALFSQVYALTTKSINL